MEHLRYHKIPLVRSEKIKGRRENNTLWCLTEKIHGSNFSIYINKNNEIKCAKRTTFIDENEKFFGYISLIERIRNNLLDLANYIFHQEEVSERREEENRGGVNHIVIFGELFGGSFPGLSENNKKPVQQGIWYSPRIEFTIFDICYEINNVMQFIPFSQTIELAERFNLMYTKPLFIGSFHEACQYNIRFQSTIPALLSLPLENLANINNQAEGIVVREYNSYHVFDTKRPILKIKTIEFTEGEGCPKEGNENSSDHLKAWLFSLLNWNRVTSAISKIGPPSELSNRELIVQEVIRDIQEECGFEEDIFREYVDELKFISFNLLATNS